MPMHSFVQIHVHIIHMSACLCVCVSVHQGANAHTHSAKKIIICMTRRKQKNIHSLYVHIWAHTPIVFVDI